MIYSVYPLLSLYWNYCHSCIHLTFSEEWVNEIKKPMLYRIAYLDICVFVSNMEKNTQIHENTNMWYVSTMENSQWIKWPMLYVQDPAKQAGVEKQGSVTSHNWASSERRFCSRHITGCKSCGPWVAEETFQNFLEKTSAPQETVSPYKNETSGTNRPLLSESSFVWIFKEQQFSENAARALNDLFREIQDRKKRKMEIVFALLLFFIVDAATALQCYQCQAPVNRTLSSLELEWWL